MIKDYKRSEIKEILKSKGPGFFAENEVVGVTFYLNTYLLIPANSPTTLIIDDQKSFLFASKQDTKVESITKIQLMGQNAMECYINLLNYTFQNGYSAEFLEEFPLEFCGFGALDEKLIYANLTSFSPDEREHLKEVNDGYIKTNLAPEFIAIAICILLSFAGDSGLLHIEEKNRQ